MPTESKFLNINTALIALLIGLSGWTLNKVSALGEQMSAMTESRMSINRDILELRARVTAIEVAVQANQIAIARIPVK